MRLYISPYAVFVSNYTFCDKYRTGLLLVKCRGTRQFSVDILLSKLESVTGMNLSPRKHSCYFFVDANPSVIRET